MASDIDTALIGNVINALPLDKIIGSPLQAMITAQVQASKSYADFIMGVCIKDNKAIAIQFDYDETIVDKQGDLKGVVQKTMRIPLLAAVSHPNICIEEGTIDFELEVSQSFESTQQSEAEGSFAASIGWGPFKVEVKGRASCKSSQTRKTDTRAKYTIHTLIKRQDPPEAIMRVIDFLTNAATTPVVVSSDKKLTEADAKKALDSSSLEPVKGKEQSKEPNTQ